MAPTIFTGWPLKRSCLKSQKQHGITIDERFLSWFEVEKRAKIITNKLKNNSLYVIDSTLGMQSVIGLMAVAMRPGSSFIWGKGDFIKQHLLYPVAEGVYAGLSLPASRISIRPYYGSFTSGSNGPPKLAMGYADHLGILALYYEETLFAGCLPGAIEGGTVATCLPMEYSAFLMMALLPCLYSTRNLILFDPAKWHLILSGIKEPTLILTVPSLLSAACAAVNCPHEALNLTILTTAGYLSKQRLSATRERLTKAAIWTSYGATETGVLTLDTDPCGIGHVGKTIQGKPIWLADIHEDSIGVIATAGFDGREFYFNDNSDIRLSDGTIRGPDYGHLDQEGNLYLDGRVDSGEKLNGTLIYLKQVESHLLKLDSVLDVKVKISSYAQGSEFIEALIVGSIEEGILQEHCQDLPALLRPRIFKVYPEKQAIYSARGKL